MAVFENVCFHRQHRQVIFRAYTPDAFLRIPQAKIYHIDTGLSPGTKATGFPLELWDKDSQDPETEMVEDTVMWVHGQLLSHNPAHCMQDMAFSLAYDRYYRGRRQGNTNGTLNDSMDFEYPKPFYTKWLFGYGQAFGEPVAPRTWCADFIEAAGLVANIEKDYLTITKKMTCFRKLLVSSVAMWRYPQNIKDDKEQVDLVQQQVHRNDLFYRHVNQSTDYPVGALEDLRRNVQRTFNLPMDPWPEFEERNNTKNYSKESNNPQKQKRILLHVRDETQRRQILNYKDLQVQLEAQYHVNVTIIREGWGNYTTEEQMRVYNKYQYIMMAHGAQYSNGIASRPGTRVIEFFCSVKGSKYPDPSLTKRQHTNSTSNFTDWYGASPYLWFPIWARRLKIESFEVPVDKCIQNPEITRKERYKRNHHLELDLDTAIPLVATRFGLVPTQSHFEMAQKP